jgi:hypothetical protein
MADTALSIIQDAFEQIKIYAPGVTINAADSARALSCLNEMLDEWSNMSLACFANLEQSFPLVIAKQAYTIGTSGGADIVATRPISISTGMGAAYLKDNQGNRYPVNVIEQDQWNTIGLLTTTSQLPDTMFYDPQFPLGVINIFPQPSAAYTMYFDARLQLANLTTLNSSFNLPPGYRSAIKSNLCIRLWPYYKQGDPTPILIGLAMQSLGNIKRSNIKESPAAYDSAIVSRAKSSYNIFSDTNGSRGNQ